MIAPVLYAYEGIPSVLSSEQIAAVLESAASDRSPIGLRDYRLSNPETMNDDPPRVEGPADMV